ncbi:MAG: hypothetical protein KAI47_19555 [Deltaproteobacteria bacterium]|nr:hypothetical protein [Deltaproteobacteria bacterium]
MRVSTSGYPISATTCSNWSSKYSLKHPLLRDQGGTSGVAQALKMNVYTILVLDQHLKILFRGTINSSSGKNGVLNTLASLGL